MIIRWTELAARCCLALGAVAMPSATLAAGGIRTDGSVGANPNWLGKPRTLSGANVTITQEMGSTAGRNLFHSFTEFNVNRGQTVTFTGDGALKNVISRVTGGSASDIAGTLRSSVGQADVYLINPAGVTFAAGAQVDVPAAFHVSTADELRLKDGTRYSARDPGASSLSAAPPAAFGYLGTSPANNGLIRVDGAQLAAKPGQSLDLAAGEIRVENGASLKAEAGEIRLAARRGTGETRVERDSQGNLPLPEATQAETDGGEVHIVDSVIDVSGNGSGRIGIAGGKTEIARDSALVAENLGKRNPSPGKGIRLNVDTLTVDDSTITTNFQDAGSGADIAIQSSGDTSLVNGGFLASSAISQDDRGGTGAIDVRVGGHLVIDTQGSASYTGIFSDTVRSAADGKAISVTARGDVVVRNGSQIASRTGGPRTASNIEVTAGGEISVTGRDRAGTTSGIVSATSAADRTGSAGQIRLQAKAGSVTVSSGGQVGSDTLGAADAGNVEVVAGRNIVVDGQGDSGTVIESGAAAGSSGNAGTVTLVATGDVRVLHAGSVVAPTRGSGHAGTLTVTTIEGDVVVDGDGGAEVASIGSFTLGSGNAGVVYVDSGRDVNVLNGGFINSVTKKGDGDAGDVFVTAARDILVDDAKDSRFAAAISSDAFGGSAKTADAGSVVVTAGRDIAVVNGGVIGSSTVDGDGGDVSVSARRDILIDGQGAGGYQNGIYAEAWEPAQGRAGDIRVNAGGAVRVLNLGSVSSSTGGIGRAGTVDVRGRQVVIDNARISAQSIGPDSSGQTGNVNVTAAQRLQVRNGGTISIANASTASAAGAPAPGDIVVKAPRVEVRGGTINANTAGNVAAGSIRVQGGDAVSVSHRGMITSSTSGAGNAGSVTIDTARLRVDRGSISAQAHTGASGTTGSIRIVATQSLDLANRAKISIENDATGLLTGAGAAVPAKSGTLRIDAPIVRATDSLITTRSRGAADAGQIRLNVGSRLELQDASITTAANSGDGGAIRIAGGGDVQLRDSQIRSSVSGPRGNGGDIAVTANAVVMETGLIEANATSGDGGAIRLDVRGLVASGSQVNGRNVAAGDYLDFAAAAGPWQAGVFGGNIIRAVSQSGVSGQISLASPQLNLAGAIANLGNPAFDTGELNPTACSPDAGSSLSVTGRGGLPARAKDWKLY